MGTYLHGVFDHPQANQALLAWAGHGDIGEFDYPALREQQVERLANAVERHLNLPRIFAGIAAS